MKDFLAGLIVCALGVSYSLQSAASETSAETVVYSFCAQQNCTDGERPLNGVIYVNGMLYGTTPVGGNEGCAIGCGTLFSLDPDTGVETVLHSFPDSNTDGYFPSSNLIDANGMPYGMTSQGGAYGYYESYTGTVYSFDLNNNVETVLHSFCRTRKCKDGSYPTGGVIVRNILFGTALYGGKDHGGLGGAIFSLRLGADIERVRHSFQYENEDGYNPDGDLIDVDNLLYGVTYEGGDGTCYGAGFDGCGTIFSLDPKSGVETVLHSFSNGDTDGAFPYAGVLKVGDKLYGTTYVGGLGACFAQQGATGCGTVFSVDLKTGAEKILHFFCSQQNCADGDEPFAGLIDVNGVLYGTTSGGGAKLQGTVFSVDPKTGTEAVVHSFCSQKNCSDGSEPSAGLINVDGTLYGTTEFGGAYNEGTVFRVVP